MLIIFYDDNHDDNGENNVLTIRCFPVTMLHL